MADSADFEFDAQTPGGLKAHLSIKSCRPNRDIPEMGLNVCFEQSADGRMVAGVNAGKLKKFRFVSLTIHNDQEALGFAALLQAVGAAIEKETPGWFKQPKEVVLVSEDRWPPVD